MLTDAGLAVTGDKKTLVIYVLQQLNVMIPWDVEALIEALTTAVQTGQEAESGWATGGGAAPESTPASTMAQQLKMTVSMAALVETMKKEMDWQVQAMTALSATVAKLSGQQPPSRLDE
eukprot:1934044-Rhodomonas_salina.3